MMFDAAITEFPFVDALPKREKSRLARTWELIRVMSAVTEKEGQLVPVMLAAKCLGYSRSSVDDAVLNGHLKRVDIDGHVFITENSIVEFAKKERRMGRPPMKQVSWVESREIAAAMVAKKS